MKWFNFKRNMEQYKTLRVIKKRRKLLVCLMYAGLSMCFVPFVVCDNEWTHHLTYEQIFNGTDFIQVSRPYNLPISSSFNGENSHSNSIELRSNELENYGRKKNIIYSQEKLLVGFARDPYRESIPADDYAKGVRDPSTSYYKTEGRGKRGVVHLYNMIHCATGCEPLAYKGYGCYCGFLGSGRPTDGIDRCCEKHDHCYENIFCPFFTAYFQPYYWKCYHGTPLCALENRLTQDKFVNGCAARLCECDRQFAMCVSQYSCPRHTALCRSSPLRLLQNLLTHG